MKQYIDKSILVDEIEGRIKERDFQMKNGYWFSLNYVYEDLLDFINNLEEKQFAYVVTRCEEHSDYVEKVFLNKEDAEAYCKQFNENEDCYCRDITKVKID